MKTSLDKQADEIFASMGQHEATRRAKEMHELGLGDGVRFVLSEFMDGRPYVKATCSRCEAALTSTQSAPLTSFTEDLNFAMRHCGQEDRIPEDLRESLEKLQIKRGRRKVATFVERLFGKSSAPVPNI